MNCAVLSSGFLSVFPIVRLVIACMHARARGSPKTLSIPMTCPDCGFRFTKGYYKSSDGLVLGEAETFGLRRKKT
jgi:hypothetical protein